MIDPVSFAENHRVGILLSALAILILAVVGASRLEVTSDNRVFFGSDDELFSELLAFERDFDSYTTLVVVLTTRNSLDSSASHAALHKQLSEDLLLLGAVERVSSLWTQSLAVDTDDGVSLEPILSVPCSDQGCLKSLSQSQRELITRRYLSQDGRSSAVMASLRLRVGDSSQVAELMNRIRSELIPSWAAQYPTVDMRVTGGLPMMQAFVDASEFDIATLMPFVAIALLALMVVCFQSLHLTALLVGLGIYSVVLTLGFAGWAGYVLNTATSMVGIIVLVLFIAAAVHVVMHVVRGESVHGEPFVYGAICSGVRYYYEPILLTAATTIVGFLSLLSVPSPPIRELGVIAAVGVFASALVLCFLLPCLVSRSAKTFESKVVIVIQRAMNFLGRAVESASSRWLLFLVFAAVSSAGVFRVTLDDDFIEYFSTQSEFKSATDFATANLSGPYSLEVLVDQQDGTGEVSSGLIASIRLLTEELRSLSKVNSVLSIYDLLDEIDNVIAEDDTALHDRDDDQLAQLQMAYELSLPEGHTGNEFLSNEGSARISVLLDKSNAAEVRALRQHILEFSREHLPQRMVVSVTGESVPTSYLSLTNLRSMIVGIAFSLVISALLIGWRYRSVYVAALALISISIPVIAGFGLWGWFYGTIGLASTVVIAVTIGVVVDDSIHMIHRFRRNLEGADTSPAEAAAHSIFRIGTALVVTTLVLVAGLAVLSFSQFGVNSTFAICSIFVISSALYFDLMVLPKLMVYIVNRS